MASGPIFQLQTGRFFWTGLVAGQDIMQTIAGVVEDLGLGAAAFDVSGQVRFATVGAYDATQQVWVTAREETPADIIFCQGDVVRADEKALVNGRIVLVDKAGRIYGGRLFADTVVDTGELRLIELQGQGPTRTYEPAAALWRLSAAL
jgi:predicted DNA-binding protein with PD1-like motif